MNNPRSERIATLLARGVSRIRKREGANWAEQDDGQKMQCDAPEASEVHQTSALAREDRDES